MKYKYAYVVTGIVEAPDENHARTQVLMGIAITGRLHETPLEVAVEVTLNKEAEVSRQNGRDFTGMQH